MTDIVLELREMAANQNQPDCDIDTLKRAADEIDQLQKAAAIAANIIDRNLYHQREKVEDASGILRNALNRT